MKALIIITLLAATCLFAGAQDNKGDTKLGLDVRTFAILETQDFDNDEKTGAGVGLDYWVDGGSMGFGTEAISYDSNESMVDRQTGSLLLRSSFCDDDLWVIPFIGLGRSYEADAWSAHAGVRASATVYKDLSLDLGARWFKDEGQSDSAAFTAGVGWSF